MGELFVQPSDLRQTMEDRDRRRAWVAKRETWVQQTIADLPDYATRRDDAADLRAVMTAFIPDYAPKTNLEHDMALFDLLVGKGLRRCGAHRLKLRDINGHLSYGSESVYYEHHAGFAETDWVWLIKTTAQPQIYYQSAGQPYVEDAVRKDPETYEDTLFSQAQRARTQARNRRRADAQLDSAQDVAISNAPSKSVMDTIRGWLNRS